MSSVTLKLFLLSWVLSCFAAPPSQPRLISSRQNQASNELPCLRLISATEQNVSIFAASDVYDCISKVPFNDAVALRFIDYWNQTLQFQSTLEYLNQPPNGYQQPSVKVHQGLENIRANVSSGSFTSQYAFEAQLQLLINSMHDNHVVLEAGIFVAFKFASPYTLVSVSQDGIKEPQIYLQDDVLSAAREDWVPSPVTQINDQDVVEYLTALAALNSEGFVESHAEWNALLESPANDVQGYLSLLQRLTFYPGDKLNFTFANGTTMETIWLGIYGNTERTGPLATPGDFYNYFVLGLLPANWDETSDKPWWPEEYNIPPIPESGAESTAGTVFDCSIGESRINNWCNATSGRIGAYPNNPVVAQDDLAITGTGTVSGYIFDDISTGILSIPSFFQTGFSVGTFIDAIDEFIGNATARNTTHVVIDLQQNSGGLVFLALTTFQQFFPHIVPYTGSRARSHEAADTLGTAYSQWWRSLETRPGDASDNDYQAFAASEWIALNRINPATGRNFSSWSEYFGPVLDHGDAFSRQQVYNLSDTVSNGAMFGWHYPAWENSSYVAPLAHWAAENIVLLTDGTCSSACTMFVEFMTEMAGVRTVSMGGRPEHGPMQTASGSRGAAVYTARDIDQDYEWLHDRVKNTAAFDRLPLRNNTGMLIRYASFNIRDQLRVSDMMPLQFRYEASDCRLYYTLGNVYNMSQLWRDAAAATWIDSNLCVNGSTGYSKRTKDGRRSPPAPIAQIPSIDHFPSNTPEFSVNTTLGLIDSTLSLEIFHYARCNSHGGCGPNTDCRPVPTTCQGYNQNGGPVHHLDLCLQICDSFGTRKPCTADTSAQTRRHLPAMSAKAGIGIVFYEGVYHPGSIDPRLYHIPCPAPPSSP